ncbi:hypothetical protein FNAPI_1253 [Fusarium napiforme]|uniref:Uncharacterized protein n=1 Tax=Fusarium napiforme TaxID=42672 RepID=A0A8H5K3V0_9HYPO|nr:hypothetical protein FNAPI_1253 [Fusarium napiforme]
MSLSKVVNGRLVTNTNVKPPTGWTVNFEDMGSESEWGEDGEVADLVSPYGISGVVKPLFRTRYSSNEVIFIVEINEQYYVYNASQNSSSPEAATNNPKAAQVPEILVLDISQKSSYSSDTSAWKCGDPYELLPLQPVRKCCVDLFIKPHRSEGTLEPLAITSYNTQRATSAVRRSSATQGSPASEQQSEADTMQGTVAVTNRNSPSVSVEGGNSGDENGSNSSVDPLAKTLDATLLEDAAMSSNTSGDEFVFFDMDPSTFDLPEFNSLPDFHWSPYSIPGIPSPRCTQTDTFNVLDSRSSTSTAATRMLSNPINASNSTCAGRCLKIMKSLLEELEIRMHDMKPCKADVALSFQKQSCIQCTQVVRCKSYYTDPDAMLFLVMICEKLIMLNKKIIWYTREVLI